MSHRLLEVDVLAGLQCLDGNRPVPVIRRGYDHRIDVFPIDDLSIVEVAGSLADTLGATETLLVDVTDSDHFSAVGFLASLHCPLHGRGTASATTDDSNTDSVVGAKRACVHAVAGENHAGTGSCRTSL